MNVLTAGNESAASDKTELIVGVWFEDATATCRKASWAVAATFDNYKCALPLTRMLRAVECLVLGKDTDAALQCHHSQTHFEQLSADKRSKELTVTDYAEVQFRGFIEGYYEIRGTGRPY